MTASNVDALEGTNQTKACCMEESGIGRGPSMVMTSATGGSQLTAGSQCLRLPEPFQNAYDSCSELSPLVQLPPSSVIPLHTMERIKQLKAHLTGTPSGLSALEVKRPDDVVITMAIRSPLCKAKKGGFKDARYDTALYSSFRRLLCYRFLYLELTN